MKVYSGNIYSWPWDCCWKTSQDIARHFNLKTEIGDEYLNLPTEDLAVKLLLNRYGDLLEGFRQLAILTGFRKISDIEEYNIGDIGMFESQKFGGAMTVFYDDFGNVPDGGSWLIWTPLGMRKFNKEFYPDIDFLIFRGGL